MAALGWEGIVVAVTLGVRYAWQGPFRATLAFCGQLAEFLATKKCLNAL
jgi:hypothetical protein